MIITVVLMAISAAAAAVLGCGVVGWRAETRADAATARANALAVTVINQREVIEELESRVRNLGLRARVLSVELAGSDDRARTRVLDTALPHPNQWSPEPWQEVRRG